MCLKHHDLHFEIQEWHRCAYQFLHEQIQICRDGAESITQQKLLFHNPPVRRETKFNEVVKAEQDGNKIGTGWEHTACSYPLLILLQIQIRLHKPVPTTLTLVGIIAQYNLHGNLPPGRPNDPTLDQFNPTDCCSHTLVRQSLWRAGRLPLDSECGDGPETLLTQNIFLFTWRNVEWS